MRRIPTFAVLALLAASAGRVVAQAKPDAASKIADATKAAPSSISAQATIMDWPATEGGAMTTLRKGTNGWTCLPDFPATEGDDPMCVDDQWMNWMQALMSKKPPQTKRAGFGYMIAPGGGYGSNTDPFATKKTPDNDWGYDPPHIMLLVPDTKALEGLPTKRQGGGPWVMWTGTPYVHVMVPIAPPKK